MAKSKTPTVKTTDNALGLAMRALVKIASGEGIPQLVAQTALSEIGDPAEVIGVDDILGPVARGKRSLFASSLEQRAENLHHRKSKS